MFLVLVQAKCSELVSSPANLSALELDGAHFSNSVLKKGLSSVQGSIYRQQNET